jgi:hypothetical protein
MRVIYEGTATYFREYLRDYMKKWVEENKKPDGLITISIGTV